MTLIRDLVHVPTSVQRGDFVMTLRDGVDDPQRTLDLYVVTDQLVEAFDSALAFVASAVRERRSKSAYLDGSFGSGKSHFMAVLGLILSGHAAARAKPELAEVIARYDDDLHQRSFELVPVHMIGAETMEDRIFKGYLEHLERVDSDAPPPALFADAPILGEAAKLREHEGDEAFFATLNSASEGDDDGWGTLATWDAGTYAEALAAPPGDARRNRLVGDLVATHFPVVREAYRSSSGGWVDFDQGLAEMARHAKARGHDALVLFLDELILWLGTRMADREFVAREGPKVSKLVEFTRDREIPIIAFVARQRDLREFLDEGTFGAERLSFADALNHWNSRFHTVGLQDKNLPQIAAKRLLQPVGADAAEQLDAAFRDLERSRADVLEVLQTDVADRDQFRLTYPFSPAFMSTLIAASSALQRERTALKVMLLLLVERRDDLELGDLVAVGDLFDVLAHGDEPFADDLKRLFEQARALYRDHLRPLLEADHGGNTDLPAFRGDDRLVKTLLLAALVPNAAPLRGLDLARLTALNHGSIATPIPGAERQVVLSKLRRWQATVPAIKLGGDAHNPTVQIRLTGIDVDRILDAAQSVYRPGVRRQLLKRLVFEDLGITADGGLLPDEHEVLWRGTRRKVDVVFGNVRDEAELTADMLRASGDRWKLVLDYPFDAAGHSPEEDLDRLDRWRAENPPTRTVCWIPAFFSATLQHDLKRLVLVDHVLEGERLDGYAQHLSNVERTQARGLLEELRAALVARVTVAVRQAYGIESLAPDTVDASHEIADRLQSLSPDVAPQRPVGARLGDALEHLAEQLLDAQYPGHPRFPDEVKVRDLRAVWETVQEAIDSGGRIELVPTDRRRVLRRIANPLELGTQHDAPFVLDERWKERLDQRLAARRETHGDGPLTVGLLRELLDGAQPAGLTVPVGNLIILTYAAQTGRTFRLHGGDPVGQVGVDRLEDVLTLESVRLPTEADWAAALRRAGSVFGLANVNPHRGATSVEALGDRLRAKAAEWVGPSADVVTALENRRGLVGVSTDAARLRTASAARELAAAVAGASGAVDALEALATATVPTSDQALGTSLAAAAAVLAVLRDPRWDLLETALPGLPAEREALRAAFEQDEFTTALGQAIDDAYRAAVRATRVQPRPGGGDGRGREVQPVDGKGGVIANLSVAAARAKLDELPTNAVVELHWTVE
jgi:hypothetical protein